MGPLVVVPLSSSSFLCVLKYGRMFGILWAHRDSRLRVWIVCAHQTAGAAPGDVIPINEIAPCKSEDSFGCKIVRAPSELISTSQPP